jgi:hypothetical protein
MNLPNLLIIGSMKSGTTTLYDDLRQHPAIFFPIDKEPEFFCTDEALGEEALAKYAAMYKSASQATIRAEASTAYTKRPTYEGVAQRAKSRLGDDFKAIYLVREPVKRAVSHYHHESIAGNITAPIDEALVTIPELVSYSKYAYQVEPWLDAIGKDRVMLVQFEDYIANRQAVVDRICRWLGIDAYTIPEPNSQRNSTVKKPVLKGPFKTLAHSRLYRQGFRRFLPIGMKRWLQRTILPKAPSELPKPSPQTLETLATLLREDAERISEMLGSTGCVWDLDAYTNHASVGREKPEDR